MPTYDVFDEYRYFEPASEWNIIEFKGKKLAVTVCEDIWNIDDNLLYTYCPMDELMKQQPDIMINLSASPFDYMHEEERRDVIRKNVLQYKLPMIYCNAVGSQTEIVFDGASVVYNSKGEICKVLPMFIEAIDSVVFENGDISKEETKDNIQEYKEEMKPAKITTLAAAHNISQVYDALVMGIKDYFVKMNFTKAIIGSSGGIDSAVTLALACEALGKENVRAILMPSPFSTSHSVDDAVKLSKTWQTRMTSSASMMCMKRF